MVTVHFDNMAYEVEPGRNLLQAALDHGLDLPYFCWHPAMGSIGACRQCAVRVYRGADDATGRIVMACMTPADDGVRASIADPEAAAFRRSVIEWLMANHPHDCPVCDEGGECHLQDMTVMTGHVYRRYRGQKRTYENQNLGPLLTHEMNRCIACYRCVRFYRDVAGGRDFDVFASRNRVYFGRYEDGVLESPFAGNLAEVCPTGVFTDKTLARHYTRKWDFESAPSICPHCALGCNTLPGARYGEVRRIQNRYHDEVNGYFLCDRGRFGYEFMNRPERIRHAATRLDGPLGSERAAALASDLARKARRIVGIGSGRASLEANHALRLLCGEDGFSTGLPGGLHAAVTVALDLLRSGSVRSASVKDVESADAVLLLAADPTGEAPRLDLAVRRAVRSAMYEHAQTLGIARWHEDAVKTAGRGHQNPLIVATSVPIALDELASEVVRAPPDEVLAFAATVAERLGEALTGEGPEVRAAEALRSARRPVVVVSVEGGAAMVRAAARIDAALRAAGAESRVAFIFPEANTVGVGLLGGKPLEQVLALVENGAADTLVVLENDLFRWLAAEQVDGSVARARARIVIDSQQTATTRAADLVLPSRPYAESTGTFVSAEGRAQRFYQVFVPEGEQRDGWSIVAELLRARDPSAASFASYEEVTRELSRLPGLEPVIDAAPPGDFRIAQMKIARQSPRHTGRAAAQADRTVFEPSPPPDPATPFAFTMEGYQGTPPGALVPRFWAPGWNSQQAVTRFQEEVNGPLRGGSPGKRLFDGSGAEPRSFAREALAPLGAGELWVVPRHYVFGSEELSRNAPAIAALTPPSTIDLHPDDARALGVCEGDAIALGCDAPACRLPVRLDPRLPPSVARAPAGYPGTGGVVAVTTAVPRKH